MTEKELQAIQARREQLLAWPRPVSTLMAFVQDDAAALIAEVIALRFSTQDLSEATLAVATQLDPLLSEEEQKALREQLPPGVATRLPAVDVKAIAAEPQPVRGP